MFTTNVVPTHKTFRAQNVCEGDHCAVVIAEYGPGRFLLMRPVVDDDPLCDAAAAPQEVTA